MLEIFIRKYSQCVANDHAKIISFEFGVWKFSSESCPLWLPKIFAKFTCNFENLPRKYEYTLLGYLWPFTVRVLKFENYRLNSFALYTGKMSVDSRLNLKYKKNRWNSFHNHACLSTVHLYGSLHIHAQQQNSQEGKKNKKKSSKFEMIFGIECSWCPCGLKNKKNLL